MADDDGAMLELLAETYELQGIEVVAARSGEEVLEKLEEGPLPELVVLDMRMPGLDGAEVLRRMKSRAAWADIPVAAISAAARSEFDLEVEPDAFLAKPFEIEALSETLRELCGRARAAAPPPAPPSAP